MSWIAVGATVVGGVLSYAGSQNAADASSDAAKSAAQQQALNYQRASTNLQPFVSAGQGALANLTDLSNGNYGALYSSPDYQFALNSGVNASDRSAASKGSLYAGGHSADLTALGQGLASQQLGNYRSSLMNLAQLGSNSASSLAGTGTNQANQTGGYITQNGQNQIGIGNNQTNSLLNTLGQLGYLGGQAQGSQGTATQSSYTGTLSPSQPYTGAGSLSTSWPGMTGVQPTSGTTWPGYGGGFQ